MQERPVTQEASASRPHGYAQKRELRDYLEKKKKLSGKRRILIDIPFALLTVIILTIGVVMVLSASYAGAFYSSEDPTFYFMRQGGFALLGVAVMIGVSFVPLSFYKRFAIPFLLGSTVLLFLTPIIGSNRGGATRWIDLGFTTFQPSEITKLAIIISFSALICRFGKKMKTFKYGVLTFGIILIVTVGLLLLEPHISASIIICLVGAILMFVGGTKLYWFVLLGGLGSGVLAVLVKKLSYASKRVATWRDPFSDLQGDGWQIVQSLYAVGSGGVMGLGLGNSRQKYLYLPEEHNDFIFAVVCEELGYVGALLILLLFSLLIIRGYRIAMKSKDKFSSLVVTGITSLFAIQVFLNIAVVTNLLPCTGISLPFFSYGGTALLMQMGEIGIVLAASRAINKDEVALEEAQEAEAQEPEENREIKAEVIKTETVNLGFTEEDFAMAEAAEKRAAENPAAVSFFDQDAEEDDEPDGEGSDGEEETEE